MLRGGLRLDFRDAASPQPLERDVRRVTTPLNELVIRLALLAGPHAHLLTARLVEDVEGIELRATRNDRGTSHEFVRHLTFSALDALGAAAVARQFAREARAALAKPEGPALRRTGTSRR